jgi:hypothetical protein
MDSMDREEVFKGSKVYRRADYRGIWILVGYRLRGLDVCLYEELLDMIGLIIILKRDILKTRPLWEFYIDNLNGPFRKRIRGG